MRKGGDRRIPPYLLLFLAGWLVYFVNYLGRYNFTAGMVVIGQAETLRPEQLGSVASAFFIAYGAAQLLSGWLGDRLQPKALVAAGMLGSAAGNLLMGLAHSLWMMRAVWFFNGLCCALIWAPMVRIMTLYMPEERLRKAILSFQYATALGMTVTYLLTSVLAAHCPWPVIFFIPAGITLLAAVGWIAVSRTVREPPAGEKRTETAGEAPAPAAGSFRARYLVSGLPLVLGIILLMGTLKDGIQTWVPQMIADTFRLDASLSVFLSAVLPLINMAGIWTIRQVSKRAGGEDVRASLVLFAVAGGGMLLLLLFGGLHPLLTIALFSVVSSCVFGISSVLTSFVPLQYARWGRASTVAGLTNAFCYLGSALSGWGLGWVAGRGGWGAAYVVLLALCVIGIALCLLLRPRWRRFTIGHTQTP